MPALCTPSAVARIGDLPKQGDHAQRLQQNRVEGHLIPSGQISEAERGDPPQDTPRRASKKRRCRAILGARALIDNRNLDPQLQKQVERAVSRYQPKSKAINSP